MGKLSARSCGGVSVRSRRLGGARTMSSTSVSTMLLRKRDLEVAATRTKAEALRVRRRILAGESIGAIVKGLSWAQPVSSSHGVVSGLKSGFYAEHGLNDAIFAAKRGVLVGPMKTV